MFKVIKFNLCFAYMKCHGSSENFCLADSATTHTILKDKKYFQSLILCKVNFNTISTSLNLIESSGRAIIMLPKGTKLCIDDALYS